MINYNEKSYNNYCILVDVNKKISLINKQKNNFVCDFEHIIDSENRIILEDNKLYYMTKIASLSYNPFEENEDKTTNETLTPHSTESAELDESSNLSSPTNSDNTTKSTYSFGTNTNYSVNVVSEAHKLEFLGVQNKTKRNFILQLRLVLE